MSKMKINKRDLMSGSDINRISKRGLKIKRGRILCIILHEGKGSTWYQLPDQQDRFSVNQNTYFKVDDGTYVKDTVRFMIYLEGISLPLHHGYIQREEVVKDIVDRDTGLKKTYKLFKIRGLNFDSKVIDILLNRHLADEFTKQHMDLPNLVLIILVVATLIVGLVSVGVQFR